jgi:hypothetical protein
MNETTPQQPYRQKATILRERVLFAAFITILFTLAFNGALFLFDQGISILHGAQTWAESLIALGLLLFGVCVIGITGLLLISALQSMRLAWKMEKEGQIIPGKLLKKIMGGEGKNRSYALIYCFDEETHFEERVSETVYQGLKVGDPLNIRHLSGHPDIARLENKT